MNFEPAKRFQELLEILNDPAKYCSEVQEIDRSIQDLLNKLKHNTNPYTEKYIIMTINRLCDRRNSIIVNFCMTTKLLSEFHQLRKELCK